MEAGSVAIALAAISAYTSRQSVDRAHRPFVWPAISHKSEPDGRHILLVRLHNDGAGTAYDVRWSIGTIFEDQKGDSAEDHRFAAHNVSQVIRAMRAGEILPPETDGWLEKGSCDAAR